MIHATGCRTSPYFITNIHDVCLRIRVKDHVAVCLLIIDVHIQVNQLIIIYFVLQDITTKNKYSLVNKIDNTKTSKTLPD